MPTGTKIAAIVAVVLLAAAGLYYAFVAPPASNTSATKPSTSANGLSAQTPSTLAPTSPIGSSTASTASSETVHTVASGETLSGIAKRYLGSENAWRAIAKANPTVDPTAMKIGTKLKIPARESGSVASSGSSSGGSATTASRTTAPSTSGASGDMHTVASGDTLASIARRYYGNSKHWQRIYDANRSVIGSDPAALKIGQKLSLPSKTAVVGAEKVER